MSKSRSKTREEAGDISSELTYLNEKSSMASTMDSNSSIDYARRASSIFKDEMPEEDAISMKLIEEEEMAAQLDPYSSVEKDVARKVRASLAVGEEETRTESFIRASSTVTTQSIEQLDDCINIEANEIADLDKQIKDLQNLRRYHIDELERFKRIKVANVELMETLSTV